jgi:hypothetical protein
LRHSRAATGSATGLCRNGSVTTTAATTNVFPRASGRLPGGAVTDPS